MRFSIRLMMGVVVLIAAGVASMRAASYPLANLWFTASWLAAAVATVGAFAKPSARRLPWLGFAVFSWSYMFIALGPWDRTYNPPTFFTSNLIARSIPAVKPDVTPNSFLDDWTGETAYLAYRRTGHAMAALAVGILGSIVGGRFARAEEARSSGRSGGIEGGAPLAKPAADDPGA